MPLPALAMVVPATGGALEAAPLAPHPLAAGATLGGIVQRDLWRDRRIGGPTDSGGTGEKRIHQIRRYMRIGGYTRQRCTDILFDL